MEPIVIDGSFGEGGGSILRISAGLACVINKPIRIINIRKNRTKPGLRLQHLVGLQALASLTGGKTSTIEVGSTEIELFPGEKWSNKIDVSIATAGNIGLLTQTLQNALFLAPPPNCEYKINVQGGGTYGKYAPGPDYLNNVTYTLFKQMGYNVNIEVIQHGFFPKGGGEACITIQPKTTLAEYQPIWFEERGELLGIKGVIHVEERLWKPKVAERILASIKQHLSAPFAKSIEVEITPQYHKSLSTGVGVDVWSEFSNGEVLGAGTILGERGVSSEKVGKKVAVELNKILNGTATVDEFASDQILPLLCLIEQPSKFRLASISSHFKTNLDLLEFFFHRKWELTKTTGGFFVEYQ
ncbi:RNA 3'-terminal phosphate cyclase [Candidatus Lokiarchaeum ossiferum]|uniref:RNA 3'-terminal phosphate cyclase n=1 Tax=Candidatus Lokiarchaeum ossiferum TaxID=2951803 RepID=A0ABY6HT56_9ARCH|nr:RNA 3'-terminal phosphate cyclase [Candidatus Lokiarchaeum sp. B-35]